MAVLKQPENERIFNENKICERSWPFCRKALKDSGALSWRLK
mgnify:CR=1